MLTNVAVSLRQKELKTSGSLFGEVKGQESAEKQKIRSTAMECHSVTKVQSDRRWTRSCPSCTHGALGTARGWDAGCWGLSHSAVTAQPQVPVAAGSSAGLSLRRWRGGRARITVGQQIPPAPNAGRSAPTSSGENGQTASSSAPALHRLLVPLSASSLLSLDAETTAVSARGLSQGHLVPDSCVFPGDSQLTASVAFA